MKRISITAALAAGLALCIILSVGHGYAVEKMTLSGTVLEVNDLSATAKGNASFTSPPPKGPMKPGTTHVESLKADSIRLELVRGADRKRTLKEAAATGGVVITGKRAEQGEDESGSPITTIQDFRATAQSATLVQAQDTVVLTGNVTVKVTEPGAPEPVWALSGKKVTISLKDNKMRIEGEAGKPAAITVTPKEEQK